MPPPARECAPRDGGAEHARLRRASAPACRDDRKRHHRLGAFRDGHRVIGAGRLPRPRGFELPVLRVALVATGDLRHERGRAVSSPDAAARILAPFLDDAPATCRLALALLDERERLLGVALRDGETLSACCLRPSEVFEPAIVAGAAGLYVAHRHRGSKPCGLRPDFVSTEHVWTMGRKLGLHVHDHLLFDGRGRYASLRASREVWRLWPWDIKHTPRVALPVFRPAVDARPSARKPRTGHMRDPRPVLRAR
jgi:hypothetical protein